MGARRQDWVETLNEVKCSSVKGNMLFFREISNGECLVCAADGLAFTVISMRQQSAAKEMVPFWGPFSIECRTGWG